ncbi:hypothetical protein GCM10023238_08280 [Streptomyces heliomycini]
MAARRAGVHDLIDGLPTGNDTFLSRMFEKPADDDPASGMLLSGGQWQRVALARAFLRDDRDLLILDEPSSGLDAEAEYEIHKRLGEYRAGRTSLLISHRMGTTRAATTSRCSATDGSPSKATRAPPRRRGIYARLFRTQSRGYREPDEAEADCPGDTDRGSPVCHLVRLLPTYGAARTARPSRRGGAVHITEDADQSAHVPQSAYQV